MLFFRMIFKISKTSNQIFNKQKPTKNLDYKKEKFKISHKYTIKMPKSDKIYNSEIKTQI